jgi:4'-phosphopantetheinyl transferase
VSPALAIDPGMDLAALGIELQLWLFDLDAWDGVADGLPEAVTQRAARFVRDADRRRYLASQAALRRSPGVRPAPWRTGTHGKPALVDGPPHFNLSRRDGWAVVGVSGTHELGVDIETLRPIDDAPALAQLHFTPREREAMTAAPGFLRVWTRKEACMKATGLGLSLAPASFECGARAEPARVRVQTRQRAWSLLVNTPALVAPVVVSWAVVLA